MCCRQSLAENGTLEVIPSPFVLIGDVVKLSTVVPLVTQLLKRNKQDHSQTPSSFWSVAPIQTLNLLFPTSSKKWRHVASLIFAKVLRLRLVPLFLSRPQVALPFKLLPILWAGWHAPIFKVILYEFYPCSLFIILPSFHWYSSNWNWSDINCNWI